MEKSLGLKIKSIRKSRKLSQRQLAELAGISEISIRKYEKDLLNPKYSTLEKIADALNISIFEFLELEAQIEAQFEEHYNIPEKSNLELELQTMLNTSDIKLSMSLMLSNFKCFKPLINNNMDEKDLDLLSEVVSNNIKSILTIFNKVKLPFHKDNGNIQNKAEQKIKEDFENYFEEGTAEDLKEVEEMANARENVLKELSTKMGVIEPIIKHTQKD